MLVCTRESVRGRELKREREKESQKGRVGERERVRNRERERERIDLVYMRGDIVSNVPSKLGAYKPVKARFWPWLSGKSPENLETCSLFSRSRVHLRVTRPLEPFLNLRGGANLI